MQKRLTNKTYPQNLTNIKHKQGNNYYTTMKLDGKRNTMNQLKI